MTARVVRLPDGRLWLRVADPEWDDPLDPGYAEREGGRWNPPGSYPTLYLSADPATARLQVHRMLRGSPTTIEELRADAYELVAATLPDGQRAADAVSGAGLEALGLASRYPVGPEGERVGHERCRPIGQRVEGGGLDGVWCRSAVTLDGRGRELAWFPGPGEAATEAWERRPAVGEWRSGEGWSAFGVAEPPTPAPEGS